MKKIITIMVLALILPSLVGATASDLAMQVGQDGATRLMAGNAQFQAAAQAYNMIQDPMAAVTDAAMQQVAAASPEFYSAYQAMTNPASFAQGQIMEQICADDQDLCDAYNQGMQVYSATQDPAGAAKSYALQKVAERDPKIGATIQQAFMVKGYVDTLMAKPAPKGQDAAAASQSQAPAQTPTAPTAAAVAEPPFEGQFTQESIGNCMVGFNLGATSPQIGDISNCQITQSGTTDISFAFPEGTKAEVSGGGCTIAKRGSMVYLYNSRGCSITVDQWIIPASGAGTYIILDSKEEGVTMIEGRFLPIGEKQVFQFSNKGYEVPFGGVLTYMNGEFDLDLTNAKTKSFSLFTYKGGQLSGSTNINQLGPEMKIKETALGFEIKGQVEVTNQFNRIVSDGSINIDQRGMLTGVGTETDLLLYPRTLGLPGGRRLNSGGTPEDVLKIRNRGDSPIEFSHTCGKTEEGIAMLNICEDDGALRIEALDTEKVSVTHMKSYKAQRDMTLEELMGEMKPGANKRMVNRFTIAACADSYNQALKTKDENCADISEGSEILIPQIITQQGKKGKLGLKILEDSKVILDEGAVDVTSLLGTTVKADAEEEKLSIMMKPMTITAGERGIGTEAAERTLEGLGTILDPLSMPEVEMADQSLKQMDEGMAVCGCSEDVSTESASITGMAAGGMCTADTCEVDMGGIELPKPVITTKWHLTKTNELMINGNRPTFVSLESSFGTRIMLPEGVPIWYYINKNGQVRGHIPELDASQIFTDLQLDKPKMDKYLMPMCEESADCKRMWIQGVLEPGVEEVPVEEAEAAISQADLSDTIAVKAAELSGKSPHALGKGTSNYVKSVAASDPDSGILYEKIANSVPLSKTEWVQFLNYCCSATMGTIKTACGCSG